MNGSVKYFKWCVAHKYLTIERAKRLVRQYQQLEHTNAAIDVLTFLSERLGWDADRIEEIRRGVSSETRRNNPTKMGNLSLEETSGGQSYDISDSFAMDLSEAQQEIKKQQEQELAAKRESTKN